MHFNGEKKEKKVFCFFSIKGRNNQKPRLDSNLGSPGPGGHFYRPSLAHSLKEEEAKVLERSQYQIQKV